jgi:hypothetical protein
MDVIRLMNEASELLKTAQVGLHKSINYNEVNKILTLSKKAIPNMQPQVLQEFLKGMELLRQLLSANTSQNQPPKTKQIDILEEFATTRQNDQQTEYLLHRGTEDGEYDASAVSDHDFKTTKETSWVAEYMAGEADQKDKNPVVSCWIPEDSIIRVDNAQGNNGTWGELGTNPHGQKFKVIVKPGEYKIYSELKA